MKISFLLSLLIAGAFAAAVQAELMVGDPAPEFELQGTDGKIYKLSDLRADQVVVVAWFPKAKTPGCTKECKSLRDNGDDLQKYEVAYFTASCDSPELNKEFATELELNFPILSDPDKLVAKEYGVFDDTRGAAKRWTFYIGKDGKVLFIDKEVKTDAHGEDVAKKLEELKVAKKK